MVHQVALAISLASMGGVTSQESEARRLVAKPPNRSAIKRALELTTKGDTRCRLFLCGFWKSHAFDVENYLSRFRPPASGSPFTSGGFRKPHILTESERFVQDLIQTLASLTRSKDPQLALAAANALVFIRPPDPRPREPWDGDMGDDAIDTYGLWAKSQEALEAIARTNPKLLGEAMRSNTGRSLSILEWMLSHAGHTEIAAAVLQKIIDGDDPSAREAAAEPLLIATDYPAVFSKLLRDPRLTHYFAQSFRGGFLGSRNAEWLLKQTFADLPVAIRAWMLNSEIAKKEDYEEAVRDPNPHVLAAALSYRSYLTKEQNIKGFQRLCKSAPAPLDLFYAARMIASRYGRDEAIAACADAPASARALVLYSLAIENLKPEFFAPFLQVHKDLGYFMAPAFYVTAEAHPSWFESVPKLLGSSSTSTRKFGLSLLVSRDIIDHAKISQDRLIAFMSDPNPTVANYASRLFPFIERGIDLTHYRTLFARLRRDEQFAALQRASSQVLKAFTTSSDPQFAEYARFLIAANASASSRSRQ